MATHKSAEKRHRQNEVRRDRNRNARSSYRTALKNVAALADRGQLEEAKKAARAATRLLDKAAIHGVIHKNTAKRHISRLHRRLASARAIVVG